MLRVENSQNPCRHWVVAGLLPRKINVAGPDPKKTQCLQACCGCCGSSRGESAAPSGPEGRRKPDAGMPDRVCRLRRVHVKPFKVKISVPGPKWGPRFGRRSLTYMNSPKSNSEILRGAPRARVQLR